MIKYVKERYSSPDGSDEEQRGASSLQKTNPNPEVNLSTAALRDLKHTEDHIDTMKRRLSVLEIREKKNLQKVIDNEKKAFFHARVQEEIAKEKKRKMKFLKQMDKELHKSKQRIMDYRVAKDEHLKAVKEDKLMKNQMDYVKVKATSQQHTKSIEKMKREEHEKKIEKRKSINEMEMRQKEHIQGYFFQKRANFKESSIREGSSYESRRSEREKLLSELSMIESRMIQRQSASRAALDETYQKLYQFKGPKRSAIKSTDASEKLPPVTSRSQQNQQFIIL